MNWGEWTDSDSKSALAQWKAAAQGVSKLFDATAERRIEKEHAHEKERAFWVEIRKPLDGVRLLALQLLRHGNTDGQVDLCIWIYAGRVDILRRFEGGPEYSFKGTPFIRYTERSPSGSWKYELEEEGVEVKGVAYSGKLSALGVPDNATAVLHEVFETFCKFVIERYVALPIAEERHELATARMETPIAPEQANQEQVEQDRQITLLVESLGDLSESERDAIVKARVGQSKFRDQLLQRWGDACSVTALKNKNVLLASHIVPWSRCATTNERWDVNNGLLLTPGLDKAFELGYIGFEHDGPNRGRILVSPKANWDTRSKLGLDNPQLRIREWHPGLSPYLARHRSFWNL
jgi:hypothetical protein